MSDSQLVQVFLLLVACVGIRCEYHRDFFSYYPYESCQREIQNELTEIKSEVQNLKDVAVALRLKLDPDFKWPPQYTENCPPGFHYLKLTGHCYKVVYEDHNWASAGQRCKELHDGAHLTAITTEDENKAIKAFLRSQHSKNRATNVCLHPNWVSAGKIVWTSGQRHIASSCAEPFFWKVSNDEQMSFSFTDWDRSEPNCRDAEEQCLSLATGTNYRWNDLSCDIAICPLCEYNPA